MAEQKQSYNLPKARDSAERTRLIEEAGRLLREAIEENRPVDFEVCRMKLWQADADEGTLSPILEALRFRTLNEAGIHCRLARARNQLEQALRENRSNLIRHCHENVGCAIQLGASDAQIRAALRDLMGDKETLDQVKEELHQAQLRMLEGDQP